MHKNITNEMIESTKFQGLEIPKKNYFNLPNSWIDFIAEIDNLAELKVITYVARHSWGYHEYGIFKKITLDEFMNGRKRADGSRIDRGTGLSNHSVIDGLRRAIEHGYLVCETDDSDKARTKKVYKLKMISEESSHPRGAGSSPRSEESSHPRGAGSSPRSEKEKEKDTLKKEREKYILASEANRKGQDNSLSLSLSKNSSSLSSLSEEEVLSEDQEEFPSEEYEDDSLSSEKEKLRKKKKDLEEFFDRWQAISYKDDSNSATAQKHAETLIGWGFNNTGDLQGLYDLASQKLEEYAASQNRKPLPVALGNLVKAIPEYRSLKGRQASQEKRRHFTSGAGYTTKPEEEEQKKERIPLRYATPEERRQINSIVVGGSRDRQREERARLIREKIAAKKNIGAINMSDFGALGEIARRKKSTDDVAEMQYGDWEDENDEN